MVTTSYVSPAMRQLDEAAKKAGIVVLNEVGMDPGIDHLYAVKTISEVHAKGGKVSSQKTRVLLISIYSQLTCIFFRSESSTLTAVALCLPRQPTIHSNSRCVAASAISRLGKLGCSS